MTSGSSSRTRAWIVDLDSRLFVFLGTHNLPAWLRSVIFSLLFLVLSAALSIAAEFIPCADWASPGFASFYRQPRFSPGAVFFFAAQLVVGYFFQTLVVCGPGIGVCIERWKGKSLAIFFYATSIYFLGSLFVLNGSCNASDASVGSRIGSTLLNRTLAFSLPFCIALHWTFMDGIPGLGDIVLNPAWIRKWKRRQWTAVAIGLSIGLSAAAADLYLLWTIDRLQWYLLAFFSTVALFAVVTWLLSHRYRLHFHHYCFAAMAVFFPVRESPFSTVAQAIFLGVGLDGLLRWGPDPLFYPLSPEELEAIAREKAAKAAQRAAAGLTAKSPLLSGPATGAAGGAVVIGDGSAIAIVAPAVNEFVNDNGLVVVTNPVTAASAATAGTATTAAVRGSADNDASGPA